MVEGQSGLLSCCPKDERPRFEAVTNRLVWPNGAVMQPCFGEITRKTEGSLNLILFGLMN